RVLGEPGARCRLRRLRRPRLRAMPVQRQESPDQRASRPFPYSQGVPLMPDLTNLRIVRQLANQNRVDLDSCEVICSLDIIDVNGVATGAKLDFSIRTDDSRLTANQKTSLKNTVKNIGQVTLDLQ